MAVKGDTIRLVVHFYTHEGIAINPDNIELIIYDDDKEEMKTISDDIRQEKTGKYYCDYTIPNDVKKLIYYEFNAEHNETSIVKRGQVRVSFV